MRSGHGNAVLFSGGGEMGARMEAMDWARTPLGPVSGWPQSLRTCVRIILTSRQPMFVWWGDELVNLYNDAYRAIVGGKHPEALGQPASVVWREIWDQVAPRAHSAMRNDEGTYDEALLLIMERNGYREETYYTFSYSPVPNDRGGTGGILCANSEDTERIIGERQLSLLRDLAARTANARSPEQACARAAEALALNPRDLPFAMLYLDDAQRSALSLVAHVGFEADHPAVVGPVGVQEAGGFPIAEVARKQQLRVVDASTIGSELPRGAWPSATTQVALVPIAPSGDTGRGGVLVAGLNPFRLFDDAYRGFLGLVAGQIAASIANAEAYAQERARAESLAELDRAKTAFFSNVSHEFRTPLTLMLGPLEDALASGTSLAGENLATAYRNALRLLKLVNALLDFSRIEAGRAEASFEPTDLAALTADLASAFRAAIERAGLQFEVDLPTLPEPIYVDHEMWEKVVLNLLSNALKFTLEGSIGIGLRLRGDVAELRVRDTGAGIPASELGSVFRRFHRVQGTRARTHEGSGIGLALVSELVRLHGGTITVDSELGHGTVFTVCIPTGCAHLAQERIAGRRALASTATGAAPFVQEAQRWLPSEAAKEAAPSLSPDLVSPPLPAHLPMRGRVLVVDDNADMREYVARLLREQHWTVQLAGDGLDALAITREQLPDLILTDVMMPRLDGFGLLRELRRDRRTAALPVIMLSARAGEESRVEGLEAGADDYLVKPFSARELLARVGTHLQLARLRAVAEAERKKLRALFLHAPFPLGVYEGPEHRVTLANRAFEQAIGRSLPLGVPLLEALPELAGQGVLAYHDRAFQGERVVIEQMPVSFRTADGRLEQRFFHCIYQPLRDDAGAIFGHLAMSVEVTEQERARSELDAARREAESASRAKDEFLAMLGHELRNPLAPILTALHLMKMRTPDVAQRERTIIERQVGNLVRLVDDLLDVSRITRGKIELRKQRVELSQAVLRGLEMADPLLVQRRHRVEVEVPSDGLIVHADVDRLAQIVANLLTNAAKYSDSGSMVRVFAERDATHVRLRVRDQGIGLPPEMLTRVFELFVQQQQALDRSKGGLGLGLAIVRSLTALHGGRAYATSDGPGHGSEFVIELPLADDSDCDRPPRASLPPLSLRPDPLRNRLLIVDDNVDAALSLAEVLRAIGYEVETAHDGPSALALVHGFHPHFCLLDIGLPVMNGYELALRLRGSGKLAEGARLIAVSGYGQPADHEQSAAAGFDAHFVKPVSLDILATALQPS